MTNGDYSTPSPITRSLQLDPRIQLAQTICDRALNLLRTHVRVSPDFQPFVAVAEEDRVILIFNPRALLDNMGLPKAYVQKVREAMQGRRVDYYARPGIYLQIGYWPEQQVSNLPSTVLDLKQQPSPLHVPIGMTRKGPFWLPIIEMDSVIIGGARGMGKTNMQHTWIQALIHGGAVDLFLHDGSKNGIEFDRYQCMARTYFTTKGDEILATITSEVMRREQLLRKSRTTNILAHNEKPGVEQIAPMVAIFDEVADLAPDQADALTGLVRRARAYGFYPVLGIQRPDAEVLKGQLRANIVTRIALPCVSRDESTIILQRTGAEKMPKIKGRLMMVWEGRIVVAQGFRAQLPDGDESGSAQADTQPMNLTLLSELEKQLVREAAKLGGWFKIREIAARVGVSRDMVNNLARQWETQGLLTTIKTDALGRRQGRRITPVLTQSAGLAGWTDLGDLGDLADLGNRDTDLGPYASD